VSHFYVQKLVFHIFLLHFFPGLCRSSVKYSNAGMSATLQPFFALQLDIQSPRVQSVVDALRENFSSEQLEGGGSISSCQLQQGGTDQQQLSSPVLTLSLEELPPVLILHLKRMLYDGSTGDCIKVPYCSKGILYPALEMYLFL
jgi:ubiquitin carboxyl-terminal hydrolase 10